jgi:trk system potassium uptake protein TrkH
MFIGGSPVGTAGGIKTVTIAVLIASAVATIRNKDEASMFNRAIPQKAVNKAAAVMSLSLAITLISMIVLSIVTKADTFSVMYEAVSASTTVGFSRGLISTINIWGKIIVIITMYLGRIGPISLLIAFNTRKDNKNIVRNPKEDISVG